MILALAAALALALPVASSLSPAGTSLVDKVQVRMVVDPAPATEQGFAWDFAGWERDLDQDRLDDLIPLVAAHGIDVLPRHADGFLPFFAEEVGGVPLVSVYVAMEDGVTPSDLTALESLGALAPILDEWWPGLWLEAIPPALAASVAKLPGVVNVELAPQFRALNQEAKEASRVSQSFTYSNGVWEDLGYTGAGIGVAILDTGVDDEHPGLNGRFVAGASGAYTCGVRADVNPDDDNVVSVAIIGVGLQTFHGTHVAGSALGDGGGFLPFAGAASSADLYDVKVLTGPGIGCLNSVTSGLGFVQLFNSGGTLWNDPTWPFSIAPGKRIAVVNLSLGSSCSNGLDTTSNQVNSLVATGVTVVAATGNDGLTGCIISPSAASGAVSVGAYYDNGSTSRDNDVMTSFSNCGPSSAPLSLASRKPDVSAPGQNVVSTRGHPVPGLATANQYQSLSGTSMATPHVAGIVALMMEANSDLEADPAMVKQILRESAEQKSSGFRGSVDSTYGKYHTCWGWGQVDAYGAVKRAEDLTSGGLTSSASSVAASGNVNVTLSMEMTKTEMMNYGPNGIGGDGDEVKLELDLPAGWTVASTNALHGAPAGLTGAISGGGGSTDDWVEFTYTGNLKSSPTGAIVDEIASPSYELKLDAPSTTGTYTLTGLFSINGMAGPDVQIQITVTP